MKTVIAVDDSSSIRHLVALVLTHAGYEVIEAMDGEDALSAIAGREVHLVLTDINMPNMDGLELTRRLRAMPEYRFVPIVMLTGSESGSVNRRDGMAAGATAWVAKPFHPDQLLAVVKKVVR